MVWFGLACLGRLPRTCCRLPTSKRWKVYKWPVWAGSNSSKSSSSSNYPSLTEARVVAGTEAIAGVSLFFFLTSPLSSLVPAASSSSSSPVTEIVFVWCITAHAVCVSLVYPLLFFSSASSPLFSSAPRVIIIILIASSCALPFLTDDCRSKKCLPFFPFVRLIFSGSVGLESF